MNVSSVATPTRRATEIVVGLRISMRYADRVAGIAKDLQDVCDVFVKKYLGYVYLRFCTRLITRQPSE
jgi:hypothetical protein